MARKEFVGGAPRTTLAGTIGTGDLTLSLADGTGYPTGTTYDFVLVIDPGTAAEEKVLCTARSTNTITVHASGRGYDGTTAAAHESGAYVQHVLDAATLDDLSDHVYDTARDDHTAYLNTTRHNALDHSTALGTAVIADLADVASTSPSTDDVLTWTGSAWAPAEAADGGLPATSRVETTTVTGAPVTLGTSDTVLMTLNVPSQGFAYRLDLSGAINLNINTGGSCTASIKDGSTILREANDSNNGTGDLFTTLAITDATVSVPGGGAKTITLAALRVGGSTVTVQSDTERQFLRAIVVPT